MASAFPRLLVWTGETAFGRSIRALDSVGVAHAATLEAGARPLDATMRLEQGPAIGAVRTELAWIDGRGPVAQLVLQVAEATFGSPLTPVTQWTTLVASANTDPAQAASEPEMCGRGVAWLEGGLVRFGEVDAVTQRFTRADPQSGPNARSARCLSRYPAVQTVPPPPVLLWVEPGPSGDVIAARRWIEGTGWTVLSPVNEGVVGEVRTLAVAGSVVTWTDAAGHVFARRLNR
jgi:hypothetical protein